MVVYSRHVHTSVSNKRKKPTVLQPERERGETWRHNRAIPTISIDCYNVRSTTLGCNSHRNQEEGTTTMDDHHGGEVVVKVD